MVLFLFFCMLLLCSFFRLKELFQVKNGVTTLLLFFFFLKMAKIWVGQTTVNGEKKEDGLTNNSYFDFVQNLPDEESSPEALAAANRRTEQFLTVLDENMKSKKPVWQVMGTEEVEQRQKRRKELLKRRDALLKQRESNDNE